ncbi:translocon-associated protein subunit alpha [Cocos nucifera]|uniref:Translocon-associated protein subunit alpha n=1 Tax=Cocos nucifera TaxID=13894 RepID=A0A8K0IJM8_COCNU|nr:translocon-associated protein subunit alpha [Cocos nucifera]
MGIRVFSFLVALLLIASLVIQVVRCQSEADVDATEVVERDDLSIVGDDTQVLGDGTLSPAPGVDTTCVFPKNAAKLVSAGEVTEILVGMHNVGKSTLNVIAMHGSLHLPLDHHMLVQNLTMQEFFKASVPFAAQATFPYNFAVSKFLQPGLFDLVGTIVYEIDQQRYQSVFYNGTVEVVEAGSFLSMESVFLVTFGAALIGLFGLWAYGQIQQFSKKTKSAPKMEVGTRATDADMDEWLQGTAYAQSLSNKSKKKK